MSPANVALPPSPPPAPLVSSAGEYAFTLAGSVDTSAASFTCCNLTQGDLVVSSHDPGAAQFVGTFRNARASGCRTSDSITPPISYTQTVEVNSVQLAFQAAVPGTPGNKYVGTTTLAGQPFEFTLDSGRLDYSNSGGAQPIVCDGFATTDGTVGGGGNAVNTGESGEGLNGGIVFLIILIIVGVIAVGIYCYKKQSKPPPAPPSVEISRPPPPPGAEAALPPGWVELKDPNSGHSYFFNQVRTLTPPQT